MKRGRVFVNSVFHNMWGEFDVNRALFFLPDYHPKISNNLDSKEKMITFAA